MARIICEHCDEYTDVDLVDYIDELSDFELIDEFKRRSIIWPYTTDIISDDDKLSMIYNILGLKSWHDKKRVIQEIENLF